MRIYKTDLTRAMSLLVIGLLSFQTVFCDNTDTKMETTKTEHKFTNHLIDENSPYLLSHAHNPVNWYPWGEEAINKARELDRPIFLSIGYSACHWCHVMEHESFENESIAKLLNDNFIAIKVDREQRPDLDQIYMSFTTAMNGSGGWPMSLFLTPDLKPFFSGTYFPPEDNYGRPGFRSLITKIASAYKTEKQSIYNSSEKIFSQLSTQLTATTTPAPVDSSMMTTGVSALMKNFDQTYGGFGQDRKFPHATELLLFIRYYHKSGDKKYLESANKALMAMYNGGLRDHLGGGFARYSVDREWKIPHFEKMLYDNALLTITYAEAYQLTKKPEYMDAVTTTLDFILNELTDETGGFYSALDADSDGEEGKFYVWSKVEIEQILGDDASIFGQYFSVTDRGNFEDKNHLQLNKNSAEIKNRSGIANWDKWLSGCVNKLLAARSQRIRPLTDDKILVSWNGMAVAAFVRGYQLTGDQRYLEAAIKNARFVKNELFQNKKLTHSYRNKKRSTGQFLEDYAFYIFGLIELFQVDQEHAQEWLEFASALGLQATDLFMTDGGTQYLREADLADLIVRPKDEFDGAIPSPGSFMIANLLKLNRLTEKKIFLEKAETGFKAISGRIKQSPGGMSSALVALDYYYSEKIELVLVGDGLEKTKMLDEIYKRYIPNKIIAMSADGTDRLPLFEGRASKDSKLAMYVCRNSACLLPVYDSETLSLLLDKL